MNPFNNCSRSRVYKNIKVINRRGIPFASIEIHDILIEHYLKEKAICKIISKLDRTDPLRAKLLHEVYKIAHISKMKYIKVGFLRDNAFVHQSKKILAENLDNLFSDKGNMLELGCGKGHLLLAMNELRWDCKGVDIDTNQLLKEIKENKIKVESTDILLYKDTQRYDLIIMDNVLEHIPKHDCNYVLRKVYGLLKKDGYFVSITPNPLNGPHDVSRWFLPLSSKAEGTHFNEMTFTETISIMKKLGFKNFKTPFIPFSLYIPYWLRFLFFWTKYKIPFAILFEKIYPFLYHKLKPIRTFSLLVPSLIAAQKY